MAGMPSCVAGILIMTFGRPTWPWSSAAWRTVSSVSWARSGETSSETNPSRPPVDR